MFASNNTGRLSSHGPIDAVPPPATPFAGRAAGSGGGGGDGDSGASATSSSVSVSMSSDDPVLSVATASGQPLPLGGRETGVRLSLDGVLLPNFGRRSGKGGGDEDGSLLTGSGVFGCGLACEFVTGR